MTEPANFLPAHNGELHEFEVRYYDERVQIARHTLTSKSVANALKSFDRAVPRHGRILGIKKVVPQ